MCQEKQHDIRLLRQPIHTALYLSVPADLDWLVVIPRVLEVHTDGELQ